MNCQNKVYGVKATTSLAKKKQGQRAQFYKKYENSFENVARLICTEKIITFFCFLERALDRRLSHVVFFCLFKNLPAPFLLPAWEPGGVFIQLRGTKFQVSFQTSSFLDAAHFSQPLSL